MTSEDTTNVNPAPAEKPRRGRRPKRASTTQTATSPSDVIEVTASPEAMPANTAADQAETTEAAHTEMIPSDADHFDAAPNDGAAASDAAISLASIAQQAIQASVAYGSGCGNVLKAAREAQGLSIHEVCGQLRLGVKQIQAIEQDDFDKLPQPSIVRGFIRNYARLLNIDVAPILEAYQRIVPNKAPLPLSVRSNASRSVIDQPERVLRPQRLLTLLIFLILAAIAAYFYINHIQPHTLKNASLALDVEDISETTGQHIEIPAPPTSSTTTDLPSPNISTSVETASAAPASSLDPLTANLPATPATENPPSATNHAESVVSTLTPATGQAVESTNLIAVDPKQAKLFFSVREDSWVRIEDTQGKKIFSEVLTAGADRQIVIDKPVNITVGHAAGTQLSIDNQPYDLTQATRGRVARIQLK